MSAAFDSAPAAESVEAYYYAVHEVFIAQLSVSPFLSFFPPFPLLSAGNLSNFSHKI